MKFLYRAIRQQILPLNEIDHNLPQKGNIVDVGCGQGTIAFHLGKNHKRDVLGIDKNRKRLPKDKKNNVRFIYGDISKASLKKQDGIVLSDVLHHLSKPKQKIVLKKVIKILNKGGVLIIKEIDTGEFVRSKLSRIWDFLLYPNDEINFFNAQDLIKDLKKMDLQVKVLRPCRLFPGSTTLFICKRL